MKNGKSTVNIFWTGGLDSTYRVCELSKLDINIVPYYLRLTVSAVEELKAIEKMRKKIMEHNETKATLLPVTVVNLADVPNDTSISESYEWIKNHNTVEFGLKRFPKQYEYLARYCKEKKIICEIGTEYEPHNRMTQVIKKYGKLEKVEKNNIVYWQLDKTQSAKQLIDILSYFRFPEPLFSMTKLDEVEGYKRLGFEDVMNDTWFCHRPIKGKPCGFCSPCRQVVAAGMIFRLPKSAIRRNKFAYLHLLWIDKILPLKRKILKK